MPKLIKKVVIEEQTTDLIIDDLDIVKDKGTYEIVFNGSIQDNLYIIPNSETLEFSRSAVTQNFDDAGGSSGVISSIIRYSSNGLWFARSLDGIRNFTRATLKYDSDSSLAMLTSESASIDINKTMLCSMYSIAKPTGATNINSLKFLGTINVGAEIEIYRK